MRCTSHSQLGCILISLFQPSYNSYYARNIASSSTDDDDDELYHGDDYESYLSRREAEEDEDDIDDGSFYEDDGYDVDFYPGDDENNDSENYLYPRGAASSSAASSIQR